MAFVSCGFSSAALAAASRLVLNLEVTSTSPHAPEAERAPRAKGAALVLNSLSEEKRRALAQALDRLAAQLESRRNPFFAPLDEGAARAELKALLLEHAPSFNAAEALAAGRWTSAEGDVTVRLVGRCAAGAACFPLTMGGARSDLENRARFLAWPIGYAILVKARPPADAARVATSMRAARAQDSRIALILTSADLHRVRAAPTLTALGRGARRVLRAGGDRDQLMARLLVSVSDVARAPDDLPWLTMPPGVLVIVPRLGALATADAFAHEVSALLDGAGGSVTWLSAPLAVPTAPSVVR